MRLASIHTNSYSLDSTAGPVVQGDKTDATIWTFLLGVTSSKDFITNSGWGLAPQFDLNITPAAGHIDIAQRVRFTGVNSSAEMKSNVVDDFTYGGGLGLNLAKANVSIDLNYNLPASEHLIDHGVNATFKFNF